MVQTSLATELSEHTLTLPMDLGEWVDRSLIAQWVKEEIEGLDWSNPELVAYLATHPKFQPKLMLCVLTYAYATGILGSDEIVRNSADDEILRSICGQHPLTGVSIKRFRRENRGLLKWALLQVFKRAVKTHLAFEDFRLPAGMCRYLDHATTLRLNIARQMDRSEEP